MDPEDISDEELNKEASSHAVSRFFKALFGFDFLQVLYLPPEFAQRVEHLVDEEIQIEDSFGERWSVALSYVDGMLGFHKGWKEFYSDHSLEQGQILEFSYIEGSHFSVRIFGVSACERTDFNYDRLPIQNQTPLENPINNPENDIDASSRKKKKLKVRFDLGEIQSESTNVGIGKTTQLEVISRSSSMELDPISRKRIRGENESDQGESRRFWFGLSIFEMENGRPQISNTCMKELEGPELVEAILHPEIMEYPKNETWKAMDDKSASYAHMGR